MASRQAEVPGTRLEQGDLPKHSQPPVCGRDLPGQEVHSRQVPVLAPGAAGASHGDPSLRRISADKD